jgi:hypothetical protein
MPVILDLGRLRSEGSHFQASSDKKFARPHLNGKKKKLGVTGHTCHPNNSKKLKIGQPGQKARLYLKNNQSKKAGDMAQAIENLTIQAGLCDRCKSATSIRPLQWKLVLGYQVISGSLEKAGNETFHRVILTMAEAEHLEMN